MYLFEIIRSIRAYHKILNAEPLHIEPAAPFFSPHVLELQCVPLPCIQPSPSRHGPLFPMPTPFCIYIMNL